MDRQYYVIIKVLIGKSILNGPEPKKAKSWLQQPRKAKSWLWHLFAASSHSFYEIQFN